ncbi:conserved hypothetical protein [Paraburkholderia atlantica]|uniref:Uncharacterized protein n=1 Tax=Paraburkholderia atlantica TaxID=2654982 RepID=D5WA24_PARAM|nr:hypothetical protein [Paraburkholderia atlantica]ADG14246.1 conserved hypothetical protein [Paraburkholderia atlantica]
MSDVESQAGQPGMTTGKGVGIYALCIVCLVVLIHVSAHGKLMSPALVFFAYLAMGFALNRIVLRGLIEWHPVYNTLGNVSRAKLGMMLLWPIRYPVLFFQLLVSKHL